jgi:hypothetical protein
VSNYSIAVSIWKASNSNGAIAGSDHRTGLSPKSIGHQGCGKRNRIRQSQMIFWSNRSHLRFCGVLAVVANKLGPVDEAYLLLTNASAAKRPPVASS